MTDDPLKIFKSSLRNAMFSYLLANKFIEHNIQKGFTPHISGAFENTAQMAYIINQARIRQRSLIITLLDLKTSIITYTSKFNTPFIQVGRGVLQEQKKRNISDLVSRISS